MASPKKSRVKNLSRPAADASCTLTRTVERRGRRLAVWSCTALACGEELEEPPHVTVAPVVVKLKRRLWELFYVTSVDAERDDSA